MTPAPVAASDPSARRRRARRCFVAGLWVGGMLALLLVLAYSVTWKFRGTLLIVALLWTNFIVVLRWSVPWRWESHGRILLWLNSSFLAIGFLFALPYYAPAGTGGNARLTVRHELIEGSRQAFPRYSLGNILPEADQIGLGIGVARWVDPFVDGARANRLRSLCLPIYDAMSRDPAFYEMGSVLPLAYREIWGKPPRGGHYVLLAPKTIERKAPLIVFLHGSGGNFAAYWHVLAPLAAEKGYVVIAPTFGFGNWYREGGIKAILDATAHAAWKNRIDPDRIYLLALSNGGIGANRVMDRRSDVFRGIVFLSAVTEPDTFARNSAKGWRRKSVLMLHGEEDLRIPLSEIEKSAAMYKAAGARVTVVRFSNEDHFLFFSQPEMIRSRIHSWIESL